MQTLLDIIPRNPLADAVGAFDENYKGGGILALMFFSLFVGLALALTRSERTETFEKWLQGLYDVVMKIIGIAMKLAPYGVAALVFAVTARLGMDVVMILGKYMLVVIGGLLIHMLVVYSLLLKYLVRTSPLRFFKRIEEVIITAFFDQQFQRHTAGGDARDGGKAARAGAHQPFCADAGLDGQSERHGTL